MAKTFERAGEADLILLLLDATRAAPSLPPLLSMHLTPQNALAVINKADLAPNGPYPAPPGSLPLIKISALTGAGCDELVAAIVRHAESFRTEQGEDFVTVNARHANALNRATQFLKTALAKATLGAPHELLASDLRGVLDAFSEISGKIENERVLDRVFATFCIGK